MLGNAFRGECLKSTDTLDPPEQPKNPIGENQMMTWTRIRLLSLAILAGFVMTGCVSMKLKMPDYTDPLQEFTLEGDGSEKVLVIPVRGFISDEEDKSMMRRKPSLVKEVVSQLRMAEADPEVRAVVLKVNSPGGTVTASDILYNELVKLKTRREMPLVVSMMNVATSGGYYISLPADHIVAHQTTITGSVGVVFFRPKFIGLMDKIGIEFETTKSGTEKDMGSPFRPSTDQEIESFQTIIDELGELFRAKVVKHRQPEAENLDTILTARIFSAQQALDLGMIDQIGFTDDAIAKAREIAGIAPNSRVVMYRRIEFANDNIYNNITTHSQAGAPLVDLGPISDIPSISAGFYYTWPAATK